MGGIGAVASAMPGQVGNALNSSQAAMEAVLDGALTAFELGFTKVKAGMQSVAKNTTAVITAVDETLSLSREKAKKRIEEQFDVAEGLADEFAKQVRRGGDFVHNVAVSAQPIAQQQLYNGQTILARAIDKLQAFELMWETA